MKVKRKIWKENQVSELEVGDIFPNHPLAGRYLTMVEEKVLDTFYAWNGYNHYIYFCKEVFVGFNGRLLARCLVHDVLPGKERSEEVEEKVLGYPPVYNFKITDMSPYKVSNSLLKNQLTTLEED